MAGTSIFGDEKPINSLFTSQSDEDDSASEKDKHVIIENSGIEIDQSLMIDTKLLYVSSLIRSGGHSVVYRGRYKGVPVALKIKKSAIGSNVSPVVRERILREIRIISQLKHENIVKFIGASVQPICVIVMEYMKSGSLKNYLYRARQRGGLELKRCISYAMDISKAMECLHRNGIIHRDLKPDNLLLSENHKKLKLGDFGLSREETVEEKMTAGVGTLRWMAPEIFGEGSLKRGEKIYYDHKVDVYSFSMVLWEMLANSMPFEGMNTFQAAYANVLRPCLDNIPKGIAPLLESCWAADPSQRPEFFQITRALSEYLRSLSASSSLSLPLVMIEEEEDGTGNGSGSGSGSGFGSISGIGTGTGTGIGTIPSPTIGTGIIGNSQASVRESVSAIANDPVVQEAKEVETTIERYKSCLSSKVCNFFCLCFSKSSSSLEAS
ncbi:hypothetical protein NE237_018680 [Protea cynaroides]|uniref:Protein kinase domain-containing protein n=1 Tax=Protea cynaroides TaxID=273540 RepID=A0A9Q0KAI6_9MAGN|nr:hypothetical protein NE237_018680 [Protea cynaroides]